MATSYEFHTRDPDKLSDSEVLAAAHERVEAYLAFLRSERLGNDVIDVSELPCSKVSLENSIRLVIATEPRKPVRRRLASAGLTLAQFQPDVGARVSIEPAYGVNPKTSHSSARAFSRFDTALERMEKDIDRLRKLFVQSEAMAERRFEQQNMGPPFKEDGTYAWYGHH
ncbi:hypothetical protein M0654_04040 [Rhizobium sp. NTR19]|uniref:Uncharacterized protein n=1 Tax=Neorhizobium turbinariae TaxID=2937795 RepID=A0ABT0IMQ9_9HYPH|nr:hypothetical protein [Neorhizobium turbinariae]MCK8779149.1 hypothetical protein [Neorhizobium turbinariae]